MTVSYETDENGLVRMVMDYGFGFVTKMDCPVPG